MAHQSTQKPAKLLSLKANWYCPKCGTPRHYSRFDLERAKKSGWLCGRCTNGIRNKAINEAKARKNK